MTGGIALINMVGGFPGGFADRYLIGFAHEKTGSNGRALAIIAQRSPSPHWLYLRQLSH
jgi:hypothetical protein